VGEPFDVVDGDVALASLNGADICSMQTGGISERFLRELPAFARSPQVLRKPQARRCNIQFRCHTTMIASV
jgi:hypothetical protein